MIVAATMARIAGVGMTPVSQARKRGRSAVELMVQALQASLEDARLHISDLDGLVALPSLMSDQHFMIGHAVAQQAGLVPRKGVAVRTLDVGGAGPVAGLLAARQMVLHEGRKAVAVVCGDTVASAPSEEFLARADRSCLPQPEGHGPAAAGSSQPPPTAAAAAAGGGGSGRLGDNHQQQQQQQQPPSPVIPHLYDRVARWQMQQYGLKREQLAMVASLMTYQASHHPLALHKRPRSLEEVLASGPVAPVTTRLECAKRADGGAAVIVVAPGLLQEKGLAAARAPVILGGGEGSGPLHPPEVISEDMFSAAEAAAAAYKQAGCGPSGIDWFGLYDCFPVCLIRALEAVGLAGKGKGGEYVQQAYNLLFNQQQQQQGAPGQHASSLPDDGSSRSSSRSSSTAAAAAGQEGPLRGGVFRINTHGGLLGFGAPWEVPAMYSVIEAVAQLRGEATGRQVPGAKRALVYGNGGIFSSSAVVIMEAAAPAVRQEGSKL